MGAHGPKHGKQRRKNTTKGISSWSGNVRGVRLARVRDDRESRQEISDYLRRRNDG